ncbi:predicted protein [Naegleria gruberi]|uniref:Predicted protein n=1 Tax=Naegleria gruberi TaxID=5762 RepID=D2VCF9_NAEGR|nr:uncharacterized protein NAEGRDRAFT_66557 [Naegleria gruberi]EFC45299.1 predicted protein [Naegleria gruberi]|eukprot:XP_002678043.1 predicted protein [Naegleria gruberi strain NEG-M]
MVKIQTLIKNRLSQFFKQLATSSTIIVGYLIGLNKVDQQNDEQVILNFMKSLSNFDQDELDLMQQVIIPNGMDMLGIYITANSVGKLLGEAALSDLVQNLPLLISKQFNKLIGRELLIMVGGASSIDLYRVSKDNNCTMESFEEFSELNIIGDRGDLSNLKEDQLSCVIARVHCDLNIVYQVDSSNKSENDSTVESFKRQTDRFIQTLKKPENVILKTLPEQSETATPSRKNKNAQQASNNLVASVEIHDSAETLSQNVETILPEKLSLIDQSTQHLKVDANFNKKETTKNKKKKLPKQTLGEFLKTTEKLNDASQTMTTISKILHLNCFVSMAPNQYSTEQGIVISTDKKLTNCTISLESSSYIPVSALKKSLSLGRIREIVIEGLIKQLVYISNNIGKGFLVTSVGANKSLKNIGFYQFLPKDYPHIFTCCYPFYSEDLVFEQRNEQYCIKLREEYHKRLYFSLKQPFIRTNQALAFGRSSKSKVSDFNKKILNVHNYVGYPSTIKSSGANNLHLVRGDYLYAHYCQDKFNDEGWGCAYRSLQTLISHAQYHSGSLVVNLPTHDEIQKCLVDCGDKQSPSWALLNGLALLKIPLFWKSGAVFKVKFCM